MSNELKLAIFDLGQVCFRTHQERCYLEWEDMAGIRPGSVSLDFPLDDQYEDYERGTMSGRSYAEYFCMLNELSLDFAEWREGWIAMFGEIIRPTLDTIKQMRISGLSVVALSNTNATHVEHWKELYPSSSILLIICIFPTRSACENRNRASTSMCSPSTQRSLLKRSTLTISLRISMRVNELASNQFYSTMTRWLHFGGSVAR